MGARRWIRWAVLAAALAAAQGGCSNKHDDGTTPMAQGALPPLLIRDDTPNLMLTWVDEKGDTHVELKPGDVPAEGRSQVRVVVSDREEGTHDLFYVVDLNKKLEGGGYQCDTMKRREWEAEIERRRAAYIAKFAPPPPPQAPSGSPTAPPAPASPTQQSGVTVIIYGASWCRPCHDAEAYLKQKGVKVVMKDIEEDRGAAAELRDKLDKSGQRGGSIPVIDVRGQILVGFSPGALDRALAKAQSTTVL